MVQIICSDVEYVLLEPEIGGSRCYGVASVISSDSFPTVIDHVIDISRNRYHMINVIDMCNVHKLDPIHFRDLVTDMLSCFDDMII